MRPRFTSRTRAQPPLISKISTWSLKARVEIWGADVVGPSRRARLETFTK
jgi:hypothetical protein